MELICRGLGAVGFTQFVLVEGATDHVFLEAGDLPFDDAVAFIPLAEAFEDVFGDHDEVRVVDHTLPEPSFVIGLNQLFVLDHSLELFFLTKTVGGVLSPEIPEFFFDQVKALILVKIISNEVFKFNDDILPRFLVFDGLGLPKKCKDSHDLLIVASIAFYSHGCD